MSAILRLFTYSYAAYIMLYQWHEFIWFTNSLPHIILDDDDD